MRHSLCKTRIRSGRHGEQYRLTVQCRTFKSSDVILPVYHKATTQRYEILLPIDVSGPHRRYAVYV